MGEDQGRRVVVGVTVEQPAVVVQEAARFARAFGAKLVCAHVVTGDYVVREDPDGSVESRPVDPDLPEWSSATFDPGLADRIQQLAREAEVEVGFRELAGDVATALDRLAEVLGAEMIVVGSRHGGLRISMREFFGGSVAVHLAHRQARPLVVIPVDPKPRDRLAGEHPHDRG